MIFGGNYYIVVILLGHLPLQKVQAKTLISKSLMTQQTHNTKETTMGHYDVQMVANGRNISKTEEKSSDTRSLDDICPEDSDCEDFFESIKYFMVEFIATFAGLSWGAWSNIVFAFSQINS